METDYDGQFDTDVWWEAKNSSSETFPSSILSSKSLTLSSTFSAYKRKEKINQIWAYWIRILVVVWTLKHASQHNKSNQIQ